MTALKIFSQSEVLSYLSGDRPSIKKITYTYDSMNRRVARTDENGTTQYLYGNPNHPFQLTGVRSPSGSLSRYHYDDFGLLFALERDNNWYYITTDQLGTPRVVCDANGELVKVLEYDSFGQVMADSNPEFELHISFAGGLIDGETELVRFGFRDYDAVAGKWTAKDPIGFAAREGNLYGYVVNNPVNLVDSMGLDPSRSCPVKPDVDSLTRLIDDTALHISGGAYWCGIARDASKASPSEIRSRIPRNNGLLQMQYFACAVHDIQISQAGVPWYNLSHPKIIDANRRLAENSPYPEMQELFYELTHLGEKMREEELKKR